MKKKILLTVLTLICAAACGLGAAACSLFGGGNQEHEHEYDTAWAEDETYHWHECFAAGDCDAKQKDKSMHVDADNDGHCDVCGHFKDSIPEKPVRIDYSVTDTKIIVENAYYGAEEITSHYTEYRLDDGEWYR
ncbi:MAG: hypothetical protein K2N52_04585, partial [Clostridia bacterium]|nr:hypothetical protein [Clostridia bacterium]